MLPALLPDTALLVARPTRAMPQIGEFHHVFMQLRDSFGRPPAPDTTPAQAFDPTDGAPGHRDDPVEDSGDSTVTCPAPPLAPAAMPVASPDPDTRIAAAAPDSTGSPLPAHRPTPPIEPTIDTVTAALVLEGGPTPAGQAGVKDGAFLVPQARADRLAPPARVAHPAIPVVAAEAAILLPTQRAGAPAGSPDDAVSQVSPNTPVDRPVPVERAPGPVAGVPPSDIGERPRLDRNARLTERPGPAQRLSGSEYRVALLPGLKQPAPFPAPAFAPTARPEPGPAPGPAPGSGPVIAAAPPTITPTPDHAARAVPAPVPSPEAAPVARPRATTAPTPPIATEGLIAAPLRPEADTAGDVPFSVAPMPTAHAPTLASPGSAPLADTLRHVPAQIAAAMPERDGPGFDLRLDPEELGPVRLKLISHDQGSLLVVHAERPETLDLMRRHIGALETDLRALGHTQVSLRFDGGQSGQGQTPPGAFAHGQGGRGRDGDATGGGPPSGDARTSPITPPPCRPLSTDRLDLRL
ncbi:MAG: flagellar hook-length control protein FliK [Rhodobacter sp.]|nr:flagellar hook-length control protein FliK [Rhodobacter sp.]